MAQKKVDEVTGVETTGHEWDGISELNNPMPRWWVSLFYACIVFGLGYTIFFPAWPLVNTATAGLLGYTSRGELLNRTLPAHAAMQAEWRDLIAEASLEEIRADESLFNFALASGAANFALNCSQCHGAGAAGNAGGFPNLNDDAWIWGGTVEDIYTTLMHGIRYEQDEDTRISDMPAFGRDELLERDQIVDVAWYVRQLSGQEHDAAAAERGAVVYEEQCGFCHGESGEGMAEVGAPNLSDAIWLYGGTHEEIVAQINSPRQGVMPAWGDRLGETTVKQLAVFVHGLGGGQ